MTSSFPCGPMTGLLVDDDALYLRTLQRSLRKRGLESVTAQSLQEALTLASQHRPDFALIDLRLGQDSGIRLIEPLKELRDDMRILLVTGYASVATAVDAIKRGADNYLLKPVAVDAILRALEDGPMPQAAAEATLLPLNRIEWEHIQRALSETNGNISAAARLLGVHRRSLQRKLAKRPGPERTPSAPA